jgi:tetratricopeptide (TPR) repeat protein
MKKTSLMMRLTVRTLSLISFVHFLGAWHAPLQAQTVYSTSPQDYAVEADGKSSLSPEEFMDTQAADLLNQGRYEDALVELEILKLLYPKDVTIQRYIGIANFKLNRFDPAKEYFEKALNLDQSNIAARFYLAEAHAFSGNFESAKTAYEEVISQDALTRYAEASRRRLEELKEPVPDLSAEPYIAEKPWTFNFSTGYAYDDNATLNPSDAELRSLSDNNAGRYDLSADGTYRFFEGSAGTVEGDYFYGQSLYDDGLNSLNTYTNAAGISYIHPTELLGKPLTLRLREGALHMILDEKIFLFSNSISASAYYEITERFQPSLIYTFFHNKFDDDSEDPNIFSRDGDSHSVIWLNTWFLNAEGNMHVTLGYDYQHDDTEGMNFTRDLNGGRFIFHFPLPRTATEAELDLSYQHDDRPKYIADTESDTRRSDTWYFTFTLEHPISETWKIKAFYTYERAFARNNSFEYRRSVGGSSLHWEV